MANQRFRVLGIRVEKDRYAWARTPDGEPVTGWSDEFLESKAGMAEVVHFKRFVIRSEIRDAQGSTEFEMLLDARGDTVTILAKKCRYASDTIANALNVLLKPFYPGGEYPVFMHAGVGDGNDLSVCQVIDAVRLAGVLHVFKDKDAELRYEPKPREKRHG